jgi:hypothetical protein
MSLDSDIASAARRTTEKAALGKVRRLVDRLMREDAAQQRLGRQVLWCMGLAALIAAGILAGQWLRPGAREGSDPELNARMLQCVEQESMIIQLTWSRELALKSPQLNRKEHEALLKARSGEAAELAWKSCRARFS